MNEFMKKQVTDRRDWRMVDGREGTMYFDAEDFTGKQAREAYGPPQAIDTVELVSGYGARLSAPGYLDCTEWSVYETAEEAAAALDEMFPDDEDEDEDA